MRRATRRWDVHPTAPRKGTDRDGCLAEHLVPVNGDAPDVTVDFVAVSDEVVGPLGAKDAGESGQVGAAAEP